MIIVIMTLHYKCCTSCHPATEVLLARCSVGLGSCFGVLTVSVDTGSRFGSPIWSPLGVLQARTGSTEAQEGSPEALAGPAGQAGRPRRQSKGRHKSRKLGRSVRMDCTRE